MEVTYSRLHNWHHDDYAIAKADIWAQVGDISESMIFGRQVLCAIYIRPARNPKTGIEYTDKQQAEDIAQGKAMMVLQLGPSAFDGSPDELLAMFGPAGPPKVGDWLWARSNVGEPLQMAGEGAGRITYKDRRDETQNSYPFDGWPCRVLSDESFIGRVAKPHQVV
jgi:hypothetical protein